MFPMTEIGHTDSASDMSHIEIQGGSESETSDIAIAKDTRGDEPSSGCSLRRAGILATAILAILLLVGVTAAVALLCCNKGIIKI